MGKKKAWIVPFSLLLVLAVFANPVSAGRKKHENRANRWQAADLRPFSILYIEDFVMADPKAKKRKKVALVNTVPQRLADYIEASLEPGLFEVHRGEAEPVPGALVLRGRITQYKPGSPAARFMLAGAGSSHLDFEVELVDAESGERLARIDGKRTWAWGGAYGATKGIDDMEQNVALELALYLKRCKQDNLGAGNGEVATS